MESHWDLDFNAQSDSGLDYTPDGYTSFSDHSSNSRDDVSSDHTSMELEALRPHFNPTSFSDVELLAYVEDALNRGEKFNAIAESLNMSRNSLSRQLKGMGWGGVYHSIGLDDLVAAINSHVPMSRGGCNWGIRTVAASLRSSLGLCIPREVVQNALVSMQPEHMQRRQVRALFWGHYDITEPMILWHMDYKWAIILIDPTSYDKLAKWKIKIHGVIDGGTHFVLWVVVATDKKAETIFSAYKSPVDLYGHPIRIRLDYASEHYLVRDDIQQARPNVQTPFLTGSSIHNQRIEHWWGQVWTKVVWYYRHLFTYLCNEGLVSLSNEWHLSSLKLVFVPRIQRDLNSFVQAWNNHRVRSINENGRSIPGHVLEAAFRLNERLYYGLQPPIVSTEQNACFLPREDNVEESVVPPSVAEENTSVLPTGTDEVTGLQAHEDFTAPQNVLSDAIVALQDRAYNRNCDRFDNTNKYLLHLNLTVECAAALASPHLSFFDFFQRRSLDHSIGPQQEDCQLLANAALH